MKKFIFSSLFAAMSFCAMAQVNLWMTTSSAGPNVSFYNLNLGVQGVQTKYGHWYSWEITYQSLHPSCSSLPPVTITTGRNKTGIIPSAAQLIYDCDSYSVTATLRQYPSMTSTTIVGQWTQTNTVHGLVKANSNTKDYYDSSFGQTFTYQNNDLTDVNLSIIDLSGQIVKEQMVQGGQFFEMNIERPAGVFLLRLDRKGVVETKKIIKLN